MQQDTRSACARRCMRLCAVAWLPAWLDAHRALGQAPDARPQRDAAGLLSGPTIARPRSSAAARTPHWPCHLALDSISHLHLITHRTSSPPWPLAAPLFPPAPLRSLAAKPHSPVSQICALTVLPSTAMLRVANSTPMVLLLSRENSLRVKRLSRFDLPVPESPMRTTLNCRAGSVRSKVVGAKERQSDARGSHSWTRRPCWASGDGVVEWGVRRGSAGWAFRRSERREGGEEGLGAVERCDAEE